MLSSFARISAPLLVLSAAALAPACARAAAGDRPLPRTLMTTCGELLLDDTFATAPTDVSTATGGMANLKSGWMLRPGNWAVVNGALLGTHGAPGTHSPGTYYPLKIKNVIIQLDIMLGEGCRQAGLRIADAIPAHICRLTVTPTGFSCQKDDRDHEGPDQPVPFGKISIPFRPGEWKTAVVEIEGDEMVATVDGRSITGRHPAVAYEKAFFGFFVSPSNASFRNVRIWQAAPNPDWAKNKQMVEVVYPGTPGLVYVDPVADGNVHPGAHPKK